jgi:hypothetical protein
MKQPRTYAAGSKPMTPEQYKKIIASFGLTQIEAGAWLGVKPRTAQLYASRGPPAAVAMLLRLIAKAGIKSESVK